MERIKRTKTLLEIRNTMSSILCGTLENSCPKELIPFIEALLKIMESNSTHVVNLTQLKYIAKEYSTATLSDTRLTEEAVKSGLFISHGYNNLSLNPRFQVDLPFLLGKSSAYTRFLRSFYFPPESPSHGLRDKLRIGVALFNAGFYFECHEYLEGVWKREQKDARLFAKSLIHLAVGMYHLEYGNTKGFTNYIVRAKEGLKRFKPRFCGVDVERLLSSIESVLTEAEGKGFTSMEHILYRITVDLGEY